MELLKRIIIVLSITITITTTTRKILVLVLIIYQKYLLLSQLLNQLTITFQEKLKMIEFQIRLKIQADTRLEIQADSQLSSTFQRALENLDDKFVKKKNKLKKILILL